MRITLPNTIRTLPRTNDSFTLPRRLYRTFDAFERGANWQPAVPNVASIVNQGATLDVIKRNMAIDTAYVQLARNLQSHLDPEFAKKGPQSGIAHNYFAVSSWASLQAGCGIAAAYRTRQVLEAIGKGQTLDKLDLPPEKRAHAEKIVEQLRMLRIPERMALGIAAGLTAFDSAVAAVNTHSATSDLRTLMTTVGRLGHFIRPDHSLLSFFSLYPNDKMVSHLSKLCWTFENLLSQANTAIFLELGGAVEQFLRGEAVPSNVARAFALFEEAGKTRDIPKKNALIKQANVLLIGYEQTVLVTPHFSGQREGEFDRGGVLNAITPLLKVPLGKNIWTFADYAAQKADLDGSFWTPQATGYSWGDKGVRVKAVNDVFRKSYMAAADIWKVPKAIL